MLSFPPDSFFGQVVRAEALPELMRHQQVGGALRQRILDEPA